MERRFIISFHLSYSRHTSSLKNSQQSGQPSEIQCYKEKYIKTPHYDYINPNGRKALSKNLFFGRVKLCFDKRMSRIFVHMIKIEYNNCQKF